LKIIMIRIKVLLAFLFISFIIHADELEYMSAKVEQGDGIYSLLRRYKLNTSNCNVEYFKDLNGLTLKLSLKADKTYKLPVFIYKYNGTSIRSTIDINDWDLAKKIQGYNEDVFATGLRQKDYREDKILMVPYDLLYCDGNYTGSKNSNNETKKTISYPLLGYKFDNVEVKDSNLKGNVYYLVAGHGGPDPGAMGKYGGVTLCEDEYAYDIALRMAKNLLEHNATVYMIVQDKNDGIRDEAILKADKDEVCYKNQTIPLNQIKRLDQRCDAVNKLYKSHKKKGAKKQRVIILHVDSRSSQERVDMFFYHNPKSSIGKHLAETLRNTVEEKYNKHQKNRGYSGTVKGRNLHLLRETHPVAVFIELGNIKNPKDQKRFIIVDNRQAVANWMVDGLLKE